jgi:hypothetical protein
VHRKFKLVMPGAILALAVPAQAYERLPNRLAQLLPADFAGKVRIVDDPLKPVIVLSTQEGYKRGRSVGGAQAEDVHLQALVDRKTGRVAWRVWHQLVYTGNRRNITAVQYRAGGALKHSDVLSVDHWLDQCPPTDGAGSCNHFTRVSFELSERTIREISDAYRPGLRTPWRLRFKDARGRDVTSGLAPAEVVGLVNALEQWRRDRA